MKQKTSLQFALYIRIGANATRKCAENIEKKGKCRGIIWGKRSESNTYAYHIYKEETKTFAVKVYKDSNVKLWEVHKLVQNAQKNTKKAWKNVRSDIYLNCEND